MLRVNERVINEVVLPRQHQITLAQTLNVCIVHILDSSVNSTLGNVTGYQLNVNLVPLVELLEVI